MRPSPIAAALLAVLALASGFALTSGCAPYGGPDRPNLVLIVLDTTRPDRLSLYGYPRPTTPTLEALARSSTVYEAAYSTSSWTPPAHASLFTGLYPRDHGVTQTGWDLPLSQITLAERLWEAGYETIGIVGNPMVGQNFGFSQGFEHYHETWLAKSDLEHPAIRRFSEFLDQREDRPFMTFFNLNEAHNPYGSLRYRDLFVQPNSPDLTSSRWREVFRGTRTLSDRDISHLGDLYDAELRYLDDLVAGIVELLDQHELLEDTVLVVTADHGENLGEHGLIDHVFSLYETTVRIPLLVRYPPKFRAGRRVSSPVQIVDIFATLAGLAGLEGVSGSGFDLARGDPNPQRPIPLSYGYPYQVLRSMGPGWARDPLLAPYKRRLFALREGSSKLIVGDDGLVELYDLTTDPGEENDLSSSDPARLARLMGRIEPMLTEPPERAKPREAFNDKIDPATLEELRILGYVE